MKKNYQIQGMSCGGSVSNVKKALLQVTNVEDVDVQLRPPGAVITMSNYIPVNELQSQLTKSGHYTIKEIVSEHSTL